MTRNPILGTENISKLERKRKIIFFLKVTAYLVILFLLIEYADNIEEESYLGRFTGALVLYLTGHLIVALSRMVIVNLYIRKHKLKREIKNNFILGIGRVANVINSLILIIAILSMFNVSLPQLFTGMSIVAAAVAILSKDYISNMINGLIIMFSDQLSLNDYVKIGDNKGTITDITLLNTHIVNDDEDLVYIPNSVVLTTDVINYTKQKVKKTTIEFELGADKATYVMQLEEFLKKNLTQYTSQLKKNSQVLKINKISKDHIQLKYQFIFDKKNREAERQIRKLVLRKVIEFVSLIGVDQKNQVEERS